MEVSEQINAVQRHVGTRTLEAGEARVMTVSQVYATTVEDLWDACTSAERIPRWFLPVSGDLRLGGRYQLEGNAGGTIERCDPPKSFAATWEYGGGMSWIEVTVSPEGDGTRFELQHIVPAADVDEHWDTFGPGAVGIGWDMGLLGLASHLGSGEGVTPEGAAAWMASDEGRLFVTLSSAGWRDADIAGGQDEATATAAAERVAAAYTAPPEAAPEA
ncbi:polyketide cyclase [Sphaerisporangium album]|uniref:Polyketide cyclase n=1 Tax=Sphaerisporangium album TaxID=509200 RepID=A0A367FRX7_9ACTN|nr:SRPBCC family protein [Sphaerisporangium album]RCG32345.1 polyketide cyclase [Sphaerisporangium album]